MNEKIAPASSDHSPDVERSKLPTSRYLPGERIAEFWVDITLRSAWWGGALLFYIGYDKASFWLMVLSVLLWASLIALAWKLRQR